MPQPPFLIPVDRAPVLVPEPRSRAALLAEQEQARREGRIADLALRAITDVESLVSGPYELGAKPVMEALEHTGKTGAGIVTDIAQGNRSPSTMTNTVRAMSTGEIPDRERLGIVGEGAARAAEMLPQIGAVMASGGGPGAFALLEFLRQATKKGERPASEWVPEATVAAGGQALVPGSSKLGTELAAALMARKGIVSPLAQRAGEIVGSQVAAETAGDVANMPAYMNAPTAEEGLREFAINRVAGLGYLPLDAPKLSPKYRPETSFLIEAANVEQAKQNALVDQKALDALDPRKAQEQYEKIQQKTDTSPADVGGVSRKDSEAVGKPPVEDASPFYSDAADFLKGDRSKFASGVKLDPTQVLNRVKNTVGPGEWAALEEAGIGEAFKGKKVTREEVAQWVEENGPKVEVRELKAEDPSLKSLQRQRIIEIERRMNASAHQLETQGYEVSDTGLRINNQNLIVQGDTLYTYDALGHKLLNQKPISDQPKLLKDYFEARQEFERIALTEEPGQSESATARYTEVNPKDLKDMPGAVDLLVRVPTKKSSDPDADTYEVDAQQGLKYTSDHYRTEGKNLLSHVRGYMETMPDGRKVFRVFEVQSDWAQARREVEAQAKSNDPDAPPIFADEAVKSDPLLKHYERLALKAAIAHAKKNGADAIAIDDAETAMLTEGHDVHGLRTYIEPTPENIAIARKYDNPKMREVLAQLEKGKPYESGSDIPMDRSENHRLSEDAKLAGFTTVQRPSQYEGMRLHYDQTLPKIAEELTGVKGERVEFGEHKNTIESTKEYDGETPVRQPRSNLIFRNPDGTPKTVSTSRLYSLSRARDRFTLTGSDKALPAPKGPVLSAPRGLQVRNARRHDVEAGFIANHVPEHMRPRTDAPFGPEMLPDLPPVNAAQRQAAQKFGVERIPYLGRLFGGRSRIKDVVDEVLSLWHHERYGVARAMSTYLGARIGGEVNRVFPVDKNGDLDVIPNPRHGNLSLKISDVFENLQRTPDAYVLSADQKRVYNNIISPILRRIAELNKKHKLLKSKHGEYFMRGHVEPPEGKKPTPGSGTTHGAKQPYQKDRVFDTEAEGWAADYTYTTNVEHRLIEGVHQLYRAIADKRLSRNQNLKSRTYAMIKQQLALDYPHYSDKRREAMFDAIKTKGYVDSPQFSNRVVDEAIADKLNSEFRFSKSFLAKVDRANAFAKAVALGYDFGAGQIQLAPTFLYRPDIWAKSQWMAAKVFFNKDSFVKYVRTNEAIIREMAEQGSSVGRLEEYMQGAHDVATLFRKAGPVGEIGAQVTESFSRQFQTSIDVAQIEMYKAWRDVTPEGERQNVIKTIESITLSSRMESNMLGHYRSMAERAAFLAPSYYRGALNFAVEAARGAVRNDVGAKIAFRAMGRFLGGSVLLFVGNALRNGMSEDEIVERLDPRKTEFLMWREKIDGVERPLELGLGGVHRSMLRTIAQTLVKFQEGKGKDMFTLDTDKNPMARWLRGHGAFVPAGAWTLIKGRDYMGDDDNVFGVIADVAPMMLRQKTKEEATASAFGLNAFPAKSPSSKDIARKLFPESRGDLSKLSRAERVKVEAGRQNARYPMTEKERKAASRRSLEYSIERKEDVISALKPENREFLATNDLTIPGYVAELPGRGIRVPMTEDEQKRMFPILVEEYDSMIERLRGHRDWNTLTPQQKKGRLRLQLEARIGGQSLSPSARARAKAVQDNH